MSAVTHDGPAFASAPARSRTPGGLLLAVISAASFGASGSLAGGLLTTGWSPGAIVLVRVGLAALVLVPFGLLALRGRWHLLRRNAVLILVCGVVAVAGCQFCFFSAIAHMQVGPALLIEYTAPAAVVVWLWVRHDQRPGVMTLTGAGLAALGLVLVLDLLSGAHLSLPGVLWALAAMLGAATYFMLSADDSTGLPPISLAAGGLLTGALFLALLGAARVLPVQTATGTARYAGVSLSWWVPLVLLAVVTAAIAYATGIAAGRRLGSRLASFVALLEVLCGVLFAWLLLAQLPRSGQLLGGVLVLAGVVTVKLGERAPVGT
jgi:drug/metabolite transporter (DMT)-like permease